MKRWIPATLTGVVLALGLAACGSVAANPDTTPSQGAGYLRSYVVDLPDGRRVVCVSSIYSTPGAVSCDWDHAK